ncbi:RES family NAD+ phosphorylase [Sphingobacterium sp. DR205]|uniref:RES family NAD+ phosphorylase n=1 Tax=Sphingobacterium sp. DR205 TaxID=2713573 RepID=UPI0013E4B74F|nr:RES family NAD+ phosphorylase [Sphingobacterium sp. DR205]QIH33439.1 RES family NAD+ phosphorylase [Sphingobacterium sp. DR205]
MTNSFYETLICSNCFIDEGLRLEAEQLGKSDSKTCPNCQSTLGKKLNYSNLNELANIFFVNGSIFRAEYGASNTIQFNEHHYKMSDLSPAKWLEQDLELISEKLKVGFFHYGPRLWKVGEIEPLKDLQDKNSREKVIGRIIEEFPKTTVVDGTNFYRLRKNPCISSNFNEYDSPPDRYLGCGRFDSKNFPVFYASQDLDICLHESRVTVEDELYLAKLALTKPITVLDLSESIAENGTEFESLSIAIHFLFRAPSHSYEILRDIAIFVSKCKLDGIIYPSYFNQVSTSYDTIKNIAIFGRPISNGLLSIECINRLILKHVEYKYNFGPAAF